MAILNRRARIAAKAARTGVGAYGTVKHAQGRLDERRREGRPPVVTFLFGAAVGAFVALALDAKRRRALDSGVTPADPPVEPAGAKPPESSANGTAPAPRSSATAG